MPNFSSKNQGTWFFFNPEDESQGGVCLQEITPEENLRIEKLTVKSRKKVIRGVPVDDSKVNEKLAWRLRWDFCIVDWREVSLDGQQLECTTDNKVKMMNVTDFVKFVVDSLETLVETNKALDEARLKNSENSSNGNTESQTALSA